MADNILFKSGLASKLNDITKTAGQLLFAIDGTSGSIYLDKDSTTRIKMNLDATKLQNARAINGTPFDGTQNITTTKWGSKRTITISDNDGTNTQSNANIDGSANFTLKLPATIKATLSGKASTAGHADTASSATTATTCTGNAETATKLQTARTINGTSFDGTLNITTANWGTARTLTIGNKEQSVKGDTNVSWSLHDILYNTSSIGTGTSWDITTPGVYYVGSNPVFTGTGNPESSNGGLNPYRYGQLIVSRANDGGIAQFYISHVDSENASFGIKFRTGWNHSYVSTWSSILDSTNYTNYTVTKTGGGASGTWGISISGKAASATRLATARNIVLNGDFTGSASFNGTADATITATNYKCSVDGGNTNSFPYHRIAYITGKSGQYSDFDCILDIKHNYARGGFGRIKIGFRTNSTGDVVDASATWLYKYNIRDDAISIAYWGVSGDNCYADVFYNHGILYPRCTVYQVYGNRAWTLVNSNQPDNSAAATEAYASISAAATALHGGTAYTNIVNSTQIGVGNADTVDNYHAANLLRSDGGVWNEGANIVCTGTGEWSFDVTDTNSTPGGACWHVWSGNTGSSILACHPADGRVIIPAHLSVGGYDNRTYSLSTNSFICNSWIRTVGATGWYNETYGGGFFMDDNTWMKVFNNKKLFVSNTDSDAIYTSGGVIASYLRIDNGNSSGYVELSEDGEGGTIRLIGPNGSKLWEMDCWNSSDLRIFSHDGSDYKFFVFGANGNLSAPSFSGNWNGNTIGINYGGTGVTSLNDLRKLFREWAPIDSSNDTTFNWAAKGLSVAGYGHGNSLTDKPSDWGIVLNVNAGDAEVHQLWLTQPSGRIFHRSGNASNWSGSWRLIYSDGDSIIYSSSEPTDRVKGTIWLKPA